MPVQEKKRRATAATVTAPPAEEVIEKEETATERGERLKKEMDAMLDEIDEVLEHNAEQFVAEYVQKGGQ